MMGHFPMASWLLFCVLFGLSLVAADYDCNNPAGCFINPPPAKGAGDYSGNLLFHVGDVMTIQYISHLEQPHMLVVWQEGTNTSQTLRDGITDDGLISWNWTIAIDYDLDRSNVFFFTAGNADDAFNCHYFNLIAADPSPSSSSVALQGPTAVPSTTATNLPATISSEAAQASSASQDSGGLAPSAKVGLGVGLGVGGLIVIGTAVVIGLLMHKRRDQKVDNSSTDLLQQPVDYWQADAKLAYNDSEMREPSPRYELSSNTGAPSELH